MLIEIILGERAPGESIDSPIQYSIANDAFRATINGDAMFEPVAPLRERFAKLKARDNLLGAVLARLGADPGARETEAHNAVGRLLASREDVSKIADRYVKAAEDLAQGLGLSATKPDDLAAQVLAINTEITAALSSTQAEAKALTEENARLRAEVARVNELERGLGALKVRLRGAELDRARAEAKAAGLAAELDAAWTFIELRT